MSKSPESSPVLRQGVDIVVLPGGPKWFESFERWLWAWVKTWMVVGVVIVYACLRSLATLLLALLAVLLFFQVFGDEFRRLHPANEPYQVRRGGYRRAPLHDRQHRAWHGDEATCPPGCQANHAY